MRVAVVGATGLVGREILKVLEEFDFPVTELYPVASARSVGHEVKFRGAGFTVLSMEDAISRKPDLALFSAGGGVSKEFAPQFAAVGTTVIDNSSAWRMEADVPLVVPEVNAHTIGNSKIIANPNCSTIQLVVALAPLHRRYGIERLVISTYQSVTGTGKDALQQMMDERQGKPTKEVYPHKIDLNCLPHCDYFFDNGYTREEIKLVRETRKIIGDDSIRVTATAVRVPVFGGHSEAVNIEFRDPYDLEEAKELLASAPGLIVLDNPAANEYPMPLNAHGKNEVFVGRIRRDESHPNALNLWIVADNLRKGAATNAVQIAQAIMRERA